MELCFRKVNPLFCVLVSDPVPTTVPVPNMAPSMVGRERHSCDALNRWVRTGATCSRLHPRWSDAWTCLGSRARRKDASAKALGFLPGLLITSLLGMPREFRQGLAESFPR